MKNQMGMTSKVTDIVWIGLGKPSLFSSKVALRYFGHGETLRPVIAAIVVIVVAQGLLGVVSRLLHRIGIVMSILWANQAPTTLE